MYNNLFEQKKPRGGRVGPNPTPPKPEPKPEPKPDNVKTTEVNPEPSITRPKKTININCDEKWTTGNYFKYYFNNEAEKKAEQFVYWVSQKYTYFNPGKELDGVCGSTDYPPYITGNTIHESPVIKYLSKMVNSFYIKGKGTFNQETFNFWRENVVAPSKTEVTKQEVKPEEIKLNLPQNKPAELNSLFAKGTDMLALINREGAVMPDRKACKQLIDMYDNSYLKFGKETKPQGFTRNEFINQMNNAKQTIFYCMKNHNGLKLDTKIERFQRIANSDWAIDLSRMTSNIIQENNMKTIQKSLRGKLVETKMIKSLKVELHKKKLDHIAENFYKENYRKFFNQIFEHTKMLQNSNGLLTEDVTDSFQTAFNSLFLGNETKMKEQTISHILRELKVEPNSQIGVAITDELNSTPDSDVSKLLSDPTFVAGKITSAIDKSVIPQDVDDDSLESMLKSNTLNKMRSTMDDVKFKIANKLTGVLDMTRQNVEKTSTEIKQSFIDKLSSKLTDF